MVVEFDVSIAGSKNSVPLAHMGIPGYTRLADKLNINYCCLEAEVEC